MNKSDLDDTSPPKIGMPATACQKTGRNYIHPLWISFINYCESLAYGEILKLKIHDGLPAFAEEVRLKTSFLNLRKAQGGKKDQPVERQKIGQPVVRHDGHLALQTLKSFRPELLHDWERRIMDREVFDLFVESHFTDRQVSLRTIMDKLEKMILKKALQEVDGNQKEASKLLGMNSTTLNAKLKKHSISPKKKN
jgi:hypothetical protein